MKSSPIWGRRSSGDSSRRQLTAETGLWLPELYTLLEPIMHNAAGTPKYDNVSNADYFLPLAQYRENGGSADLIMQPPLSEERVTRLPVPRIRNSFTLTFFLLRHILYQ